MTGGCFLLSSVQIIILLRITEGEGGYPWTNLQNPPTGGRYEAEFEAAFVSLPAETNDNSVTRVLPDTRSVPSFRHSQHTLLTKQGVCSCLQVKKRGGAVEAFLASKLSGGAAAWFPRSGTPRRMFKRESRWTSERVLMPKGRGIAPRRHLEVSTFRSFEIPKYRRGSETSRHYCLTALQQPEYLLPFEHSNGILADARFIHARRVLTPLFKLRARSPNKCRNIFLRRFHLFFPSDLPKHQ